MHFIFIFFLIRKAKTSRNYPLDLSRSCPLAVYKAGVSMTCKRQGEARSDLHTVAGASRLENIRCVELATRGLFSLLLLPAIRTPARFQHSVAS